MNPPKTNALPQQSLREQRDKTEIDIAPAGVTIGCTTVPWAEVEGIAAAIGG